MKRDASRLRQDRERARGLIRWFAVVVAGLPGFDRFDRHRPTQRKT